MKHFEIVDTPWGLTAVDSADTRPVRLVYAIPEGQDAASAARLRVLVDQANAAPLLLASLAELFESCAMVHKHWGDGNNAKETDAALERGRELLRSLA